MKRSTQISLAAVILVALFATLNANSASAKGGHGGSHKTSAKKTSAHKTHPAKHHHTSKNCRHRHHSHSFFVPSFETETYDYSPAVETETYYAPTEEVVLTDDAYGSTDEADPGIEVEIGTRTHHRHHNFHNHRSHGTHGHHASRGGKGGHRHG